MKKALFVTSLALLGSLAFANENREATNTGKNVRDRDPAAVTADVQSNSPRDLELTRKIRAEIMALSNLSVNAQNVKVIATGGHVYLRGPVESEAERASVVQAAEKVAGAAHVTNQLEVSVNK